MKRLTFTVTNDLNYDQRMIRICDSLVRAGYAVTLVGSSNGQSSPLRQQNFQQKRLGLFFTRGFGFYAEYNLKLFFYLLFRPTGTICAIDLDTILPVWLASVLKGSKRAYDAHEYFSQQKEVISRPGVYKVWHWIERAFVPKFPAGYTVSYSIANEFEKQYGVKYEVIRNMPALKATPLSPVTKEQIILYQGAVNEARGLEYLIPAMRSVNAPLHIYGYGNFMEQAKSLVAENNLDNKIRFFGKRFPEELESITQQAYIGINLVERVGLNQYYSLANKFFDYIHNAVPQITMNFPEYKKINDEFEVAVLLDGLEINTISAAINRLLDDRDLYARLQQNCLRSRELFNWQTEEKKLLQFYERLT